jgi:hypothetical protein
MTPIKPGPFQIGSHEDRARRPCRLPAALQGLSGIGIPSRKTQAPHRGQLCSIRGKSGGVRSGGEPYRRVGQTCGQSKSRRALRVVPDFELFFSFLFSSTLAHSQPSRAPEMILRSTRLDPCTSRGEKGNLQRFAASLAFAQFIDQNPGR